MTTDHDREPGDDGYRAPQARLRPRRGRARTVAAVAGAAAVLGTAAYATTAWIIADDGTETRDVTAMAPAAPAVSASDPSASAPASAAASASADAASAASAASPSASVAPSASASASKSVEEQIKEARAKAAKDGFPVQHGITAKSGLPSGPVDVKDEGSAKEGKTLRVITAKHDLSGQRELLWAADDGEKVGQARCTQNFKFTNNPKPKIRPTMLMCWRTSKEKSVVTIAIDMDEKPSKAESVKELSERWKTL
ncbi:hypothetical protein [Actinoplanes sp. NPDC023714]|uniref:hypothetical protein n=1 Tax=Actinoplanes sp. NPDC023714 TaxID=3154322 RepID=UPI0033DDA6F4